MSRNEEKARGLLNRWTTFKSELRASRSGDGELGRRPAIASECKNLHEASAHRAGLVRELKDKVTAIQNAALGEQRLRELNDEINKLLRVKHHWDVQVQRLGGPAQVDKSQGYRYFGAARDLPQVRELLAKPAAGKAGAGAGAGGGKRSREEIVKHLDLSYFDPPGAAGEGCTVEVEGLLSSERACEEAAFKRLRAEAAAPDLEAKAAAAAAMPQSDFERALLKTAGYARLAFLSPDQRAELDTTRAMERLVVERKKRELMAKYLAE
jgi:pre-mRNA-splicing factor ISY1